ncbi:uncharacterized protein LOC124313473 isoform X1 [Daphnia pulicaria]|uniref:uncharacterized protein LOC124313473 isoform X1 n=1 Tax=Daphnia pulicaria TaxID=35523 RepID=UPI001EECC1D4|nr:uncharacterized protein LOC124313473 isoform X1 [Daphnia pulicaria]XP_046634374.1 uncharacterized protein LOC124313473 isoform X1 [Daphnia pulicaria]
MSGQRNDSEYAGSQPTGVLGDQEHAENSEFEKHDQKTTNMGNPLNSNMQPMDEYPTDESYGMFFQDAFNAVNTEMEKYYSCLQKMEEKEASVQTEIVTKTEEMNKLSRILRGKRDSALQAIGQLTTKRNNAQN